MALQVADDPRSGAEMFEGSEVCKEKSMTLLAEIGLPQGLLPLDDIEEAGYKKATGYVWLNLKKEINHHFETIGQTVQYGKEISAFVEKHKIKHLKGVKSKELVEWRDVSEIRLEDSSSVGIYCQTGDRLPGKSFPTSAFEIEENGNK